MSKRDNKIPLAQEEMERLSERITSLPPEHLEGVVQILRQAAEAAHMDPDVDEIDVDIDELSRDAQRKLLGYISEVCMKQRTISL